MQRPLALALAGVVAFAGVAAGPSASQADVTHSFELGLGDSDSASSVTAVAVNPHNYVDSEYSCASTPEHYCETVLVKVSNPYEEENAKKGRERANLLVEVVPTFVGSDFDVIVFESDETGAQGDEVGNAGAVPIADHPESIETVNVVSTTTADQTDQWFLVWIVHWSTAGGYTVNVAYDQ